MYAMCVGQMPGEVRRWCWNPGAEGGEEEMKEGRKENKQTNPDQPGEDQHSLAGQQLT